MLKHLHPCLQPAGTAARNYGWRWGMWAPGAIGLVMGVLVLFLCKDSPESMGYPPIESIEKAKQVRSADVASAKAAALPSVTNAMQYGLLVEARQQGTRRHPAASVWGKSDFHSIVGTPA